MEITRTPARQYTREVAEVTVLLPDVGRTASVVVYGPEVRFGSMAPATVNWSAIGSVSMADALAYASAIAMAAAIAPTLLPATMESDEVGA